MSVSSQNLEQGVVRRSAKSSSIAVAIGFPSPFLKGFLLFSTHLSFFLSSCLFCFRCFFLAPCFFLFLFSFWNTGGVSG